MSGPFTEVLVAHPPAGNEARIGSVAYARASRAARVLAAEGTVSSALLEKVRGIKGVYASGTWVSGFYKTIQAKHGYSVRESAKIRYQQLRDGFSREQGYLIVGFELGGILTDEGLLIRADGGSPIEEVEVGLVAVRRAAAIGRAALRLEQVAAIRDELEWVAAHLHEELPDFEGAPSVTACNMWVSVRTNATFERDFWNAHLKRRQPGMSAREKESPFLEDSEVEGEGVRERDAALERRLSERLGEA